MSKINKRYASWLARDLNQTKRYVIDGISEKLDLFSKSKLIQNLTVEISTLSEQVDEKK